MAKAKKRYSFIWQETNYYGCEIEADSEAQARKVVDKIKQDSIESWNRYWQSGEAEYEDLELLEIGELDSGYKQYRDACG